MIPTPSTWPATGFSMPPVCGPDLRGVTIGAATLGKKTRFLCTSPQHSLKYRATPTSLPLLSLQSTWAVVLPSSIRSTKSSSNETHFRKTSTVSLSCSFAGGLVLTCLQEVCCSLLLHFVPIRCPRTCDPRPLPADVAPDGISLKPH